MQVWQFQEPFCNDYTSLSELYFRMKGFILLGQTKKVFLWAMAAVQNHGDEWGLASYFLWGIYTCTPSFFSPPTPHPLLKIQNVQKEKLRKLRRKLSQKIFCNLTSKFYIVFCRFSWKKVKDQYFLAGMVR